jgi:hypothetical protein
LRKINTLLTAGIIVLLLIHGIAGGFQMMGVIPGGSSLVQVLTWVMLGLLLAHTLIGIILTVKTFRASLRADASYLKENKLFWIRRISGFALMLFVLLHLIVFLQTGSGIFRLHDFGMTQLVGQMLMMISLIIHLLCNIKPIAIALGLHSGKGYGRDVLLILAIVMAFCTAAFVVYYLRWNVFWRHG